TDTPLLPLLSLSPLPALHLSTRPLPRCRLLLFPLSSAVVMRLPCFSPLTPAVSAYPGRVLRRLPRWSGRLLLAPAVLSDQAPPQLCAQHTRSSPRADRLPIIRLLCCSNSVCSSTVAPWSVWR